MIVWTILDAAVFYGPRNFRCRLSIYMDQHKDFIFFKILGHVKRIPELRYRIDFSRTFILVRQSL